tara:strand:+ start:353 stop:556 length:204 start_codon:yes stop_codon:yes gene_type:complete
MGEETSNNICDICKQDIEEPEKKRKIIGTWGAKPVEDMTDYDIEHLDELEKDFIIIYEGDDLYPKDK